MEDRPHAGLCRVKGKSALFRAFPLFLGLSLAPFLIVAASVPEKRPLCEEFNVGEAVFVGRVVRIEDIETNSPEIRNAYPPDRVRLEVIHVLPLEFFRDETKACPGYRRAADGELSLVPETPDNWPSYRRRSEYRFTPSLNIGSNYLFQVTCDGRFWPPMLKAQVAIPVENAPVEEYRRLKRTTGTITGHFQWPSDSDTSVIAMHGDLPFEAHVSSGKGDWRSFRFEAVPPGTYAFSISSNGLEYDSVSFTTVRAGGCTDVNLIRTEYPREPVSDCSWVSEHKTLCDKFRAAGTVFVGRVQKRVQRQQKELPPSVPKAMWPLEPQAIYGREMSILPLRIYRGLDPGGRQNPAANEVRYTRWNNYPTCGDRVSIGETYLIFNTYECSYYCSPVLFYKWTPKLENELSKCGR